jgi:hypothetical protein
MTQVKIERNHPSMKNVITLQNFYLPEELKLEISQFENYSNNQRYHKSLERLK